MSDSDAYPDDLVSSLARLFLEHPAWRAAADRISDASTSDVFFAHIPGQAWHLVRRSGQTVLLPGRSGDPDFVFRFAPGSVRRLESVDGGVADFALALFELLEEEDPDLRVDLRVVAGWRRLRERGFLRLLVGAGPRLVAFAARHGVRSLRALRRLVESARSVEPLAWER